MSARPALAPPRRLEVPPDGLSGVVDLVGSTEGVALGAGLLGQGGTPDPRARHVSNEV